jgi:hypothetical protein
MGGHSSRTAKLVQKQPFPERRAVCTGYGVLLFHITLYEAAEIVRIHNAVNAMDRQCQKTDCVATRKPNTTVALTG